MLLRTRDIFYTRNGSLVGVAFPGTVVGETVEKHVHVYPTVSANYGCRVRANFGASEFQFDPSTAETLLLERGEMSSEMEGGEEGGDVVDVDIDVFLSAPTSSVAARGNQSGGSAGRGQRPKQTRTALRNAVRKLPDLVVVADAAAASTAVVPVPGTDGLTLPLCGLVGLVGWLHFPLDCH